MVSKIFLRLLLLLLYFRYEVSQIIVHKNKVGNPSRVDIALVKVKGSIDINLYTPICLPSTNFEVRETNVTLAGW